MPLYLRFYGMYFKKIKISLVKANNISHTFFGIGQSEHIRQSLK